ncbi:CheR family methyltransferase [Pseudomonas sp.]|uniref:CheR family methyltransferase n=1 Tax=Pseudomonas sp. TaxID=306 RepID=UPI002C1F0B61|nr:CheR family methyltransferase [Pseudomonas sp.]HUE94961.1 CheR family methyltransferase [Pseudomonas sp.]
MSDSQRFVDFLKTQIGLEVGSVGISVIERAVRQRIASACVADADAYWQVLQHSAQERQALIEAVIVPETSFFRYPESFVLLAQLASQRLLSLAGSRPLRILSLPCATGEEPYTIVMALFDTGIAAAQFQVDALDVSPRLIERAQQARYGNNSFRGAQLGYRDRYFSAVEDGYALDKSVRQQVRFQCGNLLDPALLANQPPYDLVLCRNLLIYFDQATQEAVLAGFKRLTRQDGVIFVGPAEANLASRLGLQTLGIPQAFAFHYPDAAVAIDRAPQPKALRPQPTRSGDGRPHTALQHEARPVAARLSAAPPAENSSAQLQAIVTLANQGHIAEAQQACERLLTEQGPSAEVFYWLGLLSDASGKPAQAQGFYRKALYLQPQHLEALSHLAALLAAQGDLAAAGRLRVRAAQGGDKNA